MMADRIVSERDALKRMKRRTTCPKCGERFKEPKLLPCNHSVCRDCLVLKKGVRRGRGLDYIVTCPACDTETELTKSGLDSLPTAFFKQHMSQACSRLEKVVGGKGCEECSKEEATLAAYCRDCERVVCSECREAHGRLRSLSTHVVVGIDEFSRELGGAATVEDKPPSPSPLLGATSAETMLCQTHKETLRFYCCTCHVVICRDCTVSEHARPRHKVEEVDKLVHRHKSDLEGGVAEVRVHLAEIKKLAAEKVDLRQDVEKEKKELCLVLDHIFQELQLNLEHRKRKLVREIEKKATEEVTKITQEVTRYTTKSSELDSLLLACSEALHYTTDQELMVLRRDLQTRIKEVTVSRKVNHFSLPNPAEPPNLSLTVSCARQIEAACKEITNASLIVSHSKSCLKKVKTKMAEVGREVHITVHTLTSDGKPCIEPLELVAEVTIPRFEMNVETTVTPSLVIGTYQVTFTPSRRGEHLVFVRVGGQEIENSPFPVPVRSSKLDLSLPEKVLTKKEWAWDVACGSEDRYIYVTENYNHCISVWDKSGKAVRVIGQKGQKPGQIIQPTGIAITGRGDIYVADGRDVGRVQKLSKTGQLLAIRTTDLHEPRGVALSPTEDRVYVCDSASIKVFDSDLKPMESFGELSCSLESNQSTDMDSLQSPHSLALDKAGNIYVTDTMGQHIHVYNGSGTHVRSISHPHDEDFAPSGIAIEDELMFVADRGGNQIIVFTTDGNFIMAAGSYGTANGQFNNPSGVAVDIDGYLYVCDFGNSRLQVF